MPEFLLLKGLAQVLLHTLLLEDICLADGDLLLDLLDLFGKLVESGEDGARLCSGDSHVVAAYDALQNASALNVAGEAGLEGRGRSRPAGLEVLLLAPVDRHQFFEDRLDLVLADLLAGLPHHRPLL